MANLYLLAPLHTVATPTTRVPPFGPAKRHTLTTVSERVCDYLGAVLGTLNISVGVWAQGWRTPSVEAVITHIDTAILFLTVWYYPHLTLPEKARH